MPVPQSRPTRLVITADDFGQSPAVNQAVRQAHANGVLTCASLMVNGAAFADAVTLARDLPNLAVGLHLCLLRGRATLPPPSIPNLVNPQGDFSPKPVHTGLRYFFCPHLRPQLRREIRAQIEKFKSTGLRLDHVNGHLNLHLHPIILRLLQSEAPRLAGAGFRLTRDPCRLNLQLASGQWLYRLSHAVVFSALSRYAATIAKRQGWPCTQAVFGLLQNNRITEDYILSLLPKLGPGDYELYSHPSLDDSPHELAALISPKIRACLEQLKIKPIRYQDLSA